MDEVQYSVFYTEMNTNLQVGDRVFIVNGNYDSDEFISNDLYYLGTDGYQVLNIDRCKITLNIKYTGQLPYDTDSIDNYIRIHHIQSEREFDYIDSILVPTSNSFISKFEYGNNDIIFSDTIIPDLSGVGFFSKSGGIWNNISASFSTNSMTFSNYNNGLVYAFGEDMSYGSLILKQRNIYKFINGSWKLDITHKQPMISKYNFRSGLFNGTHNDGIFGTYLQENNWSSGIWNSGFFVNSNWISGNLNSKSNTGSQSFYSVIKNGKPVQLTDFSNNKGYGYNYILDSNISTGTITNGNFINCNIGLTISSTYSSIDSFYGATYSIYSLYTTGGIYQNSDINTVSMANSTINDSIITNSLLETSRSINNQIKYGALDSSEFSSENAIKILTADLWSYVPDYTSSFTHSSITATSSISGVLKLYISDDDFLRLKNFDVFYISNINKDYILSTLNNDLKILMPYETKYVLDLYFNSDISNQELLVSLKNKSYNTHKHSVYLGTNDLISFYYFNGFTASSINYSSIDIDLGQDLAYYYSTNSWFSSGGHYKPISPFTTFYINPYPIITTNNVSGLFTNTYIYNSDFNSGILNNSTWKSGSNVNATDNIIGYTYSTGKFTNNLNIVGSYSNQLSVTTTSLNTQFNESYNIGDTVWVNGIDFVSSIGSIDISGRYKIMATSSDTTGLSYSLSKQGNDSVLGLTISGTYGFMVDNLSPTYVSISKTMIKSSVVNNGLFRRTGVVGTTFSNTSFNASDKNLTINNTNKLRLINILFDGNSNSIRAGVAYKSHILDVNWNSGIVFNSIWSGPTFSSGVFKSSYWLGGNFNSGYFIDSGGITYSTVDYDINSYLMNWNNGVFNGGEFTTSVWTNGTFSNGRLYNSDWYGGSWINGILGYNNIPSNKTTMGFYKYLGIGATSTKWYNGVVENAIVGGSGSVCWTDGNFNSGEFLSYGTVSNMQSIWHNGNFNGGKFDNLARWKNGNFNKGSFNSYYGINLTSATVSSTQSTDYSWENGKFNGGVFGTSSTWFTGEFYDGLFQGKVWNYGYFYKGSFIGSGGKYGHDGGGYSVTGVSGSNIINNLTQGQSEINFVNSFGSYSFGIWKDGWVIDKKFIAKTDEKAYTELVRAVDFTKLKNDVVMQDIIWITGTFSHSSAIMQNSVWFDGNFQNGKFYLSSFNPYVDRTFTGSASLASFNYKNSCVWNAGNLISSNFYISNWNNGTFNNGIMTGGIWNNGTWLYGTGKNMVWNGGLWRNGNWNGSPFDYTSIATASMTLSDQMTKDIIIRVSQVTGSTAIHLNNAISVTQSTPLLDDPQLSAGFYPTKVGGLTGSFTFSSVSTLDDWYTGSSYQYITNAPQTVIAPSSWYPTYGSITDSIIYTTYTSHSNSSSLYAINKIGSINLSDPTLEAIGEVTYVITLVVAVDIDSVYFKVYYGDSSSGYTIVPYTITDSSGNKYTTPNTYTYNFTYKSTSILKQVYIKRYYGSTYKGKLMILSCSIVPYLSEYDGTNNKLNYLIPTGATYNSAITFPSNLQTKFGNVSLKYGNGQFNSGTNSSVWENGVWVDGYRSDASMQQFILDPTKSIKVNNNVWKIDLSVSTANIISFKVGDKVSIGNIVGITVNEDRKLLKDYYRVKSINGSIMTIEVITNSNLRRIEMDSQYHYVNVSKNIWSSGVFLNGYFNGIWNYGLFNGYPYITQMQDSHWIDGYFNGGHFKGGYTTSTFTSTATYSTSLIQNFNFTDNNISTPYQFLYDSWIDVNYYTQSMVNINRENIIFFTQSSNGGTLTAYTNEPNFNGYPTNDVLSSLSTFRNSTNSSSQVYNLGTKYRKYTSLIQNNGTFLYPFSSVLSVPGLSTFTNAGWTYSSIYGSFSYQSNVDSLSFGKIKIDSLSSVGGKLENIINNINTSSILVNRYSLIEADIATYSITTGSTFSLIFNPSNIATYSNTTQSINYLSNGLGVQKEYYFNNTSGIQVLLYGATNVPGVTYSLSFNSIGYYEVDMVPFFSYTTQANIDGAVKVPYTAVAPYIDYSNNNYNYIANVKLVTDSYGVSASIPTQNYEASAQSSANNLIPNSGG